MNNENKTKEYMTDEDVIAKLEKGSGVRPPETLLGSTLDKLPGIFSKRDVPSPYISFAGYFANFRKGAFASVIVLMLLIVGGVAYKVSRQNNIPVGQTSPVITSNNSTSDAALTQDLNGIDVQLNGLNMDNANADQALSMSGS